MKRKNGGGIGSVLLLERVGRVLWCWAVWFGLDMELGFYNNNGGPFGLLKVQGPLCNF